MTREEAHRILSNGLVNAPSEHEWCMAFDMAIKALEIVEEFEKAQIITGGRLNGRTYAYKCGLEDGKRKALEQEEYYKDLAQSYEKTIVKLTEAVTEQQPNEDCVSRQAVLEKINDWWGITSTSGEPSLCDCIRELPSVTPTQKWIPCSERLPQLKEQVLFCEKDKVLIGYMVFEYDGDFVFTTPYCKYYYVTAWMPFPEPYKIEMESEV